jgi:type II secretory pathway component GspD/PulD (secretin)
LGLGLAVCAVSSLQAQKASDTKDVSKAETMYLAGARQVDRNNFAEAEADFAQAVALDPGHQDYALALAMTREHHVAQLIQQAAEARSGGHPDQSQALLARATKIDPENAMVQQHMVAELPGPAQIHTDKAPSNEPWIDQVASIEGPIQLTPTPQPRPFDLRGDTKDVVRQVASAYGIRASFDESVNTQPLRFSLDAAPYGQTMPILLRMARLFTVALSPTSMLVVKDTPENRQRFEHQVQETIFIPGHTNEEMNELGNIVRNVFDVKQVTVQANSGSIVIRAPEATLKVVNYVLADLVDGGAQIMLDLKIYAVSKMRTRQIGVAPPQSVGAFSVASEAQSLVTANQSAINQAVSQGLITLSGNYYSDIAKEALFLLGSGLASSSLLSGLFGVFGGGITTVGVSAPAATISLALNASEAHELDDIQVRVGDHQTSTFRVGSKYPITTGTYSSGTASNSALAGVTINGVSAATLASQYLGAASSVSVPQVQYEDLGLTLKTTPSVQRSGAVALHLELKIEALTGQTALSNPILASRFLTSDVSVREGTPAVLVSSLSSTESAAVNGLPGISDLPGFQGASDKEVEQDTTELIMTITPRVVRRRSNALYSPRIVFNLPAGTEY